MKYKNTYSPSIVRFSEHKSLLDFGFKKQTKKFFKKYENSCKTDIKHNELIKFIENCYSYAKITLNYHSCKYSKKLYSQPALFTIIALKIYLKMTYREIMDFISFSTGLRTYLKIRKAPDYSTLQKFFKKMPTNMFERITKQIIQHLGIKPKLVALDGTGFTNDYADKYYAQIRGKERKSSC